MHKYNYDNVYKTKKDIKPEIKPEKYNKEAYEPEDSKPSKNFNYLTKF